MFYLKQGTARVDVSTASGTLSALWYNPHGGELQTGSIRTLTASPDVDPGNPPAADGKDWVLIVRIDVSKH